MGTFYEKQKSLREQMAKLAISEAAIDVLSAKSYDSLTMNDIAEKAGVAIGTIYNYFKNKEDLFYYVYEQVHVAIEEKLDAIVNNQDDPAQRIRVFLKEVFDVCDKYKIVLAMAKQIGIKDRIPVEQKKERVARHIRVTQRIIEDGIAQKKFREIDTWLTSEMFLFVLIGLIELQTFLGEDYFARESKSVEKFFLNYLLLKEE
ncbi:MAG: TetR/AcrR family transcriptional regulator [Candidatus Auribacterota bacterium]|jgi:TetR/AcrR family fatty acid metabolism transcriptional regulator|nr:TetR/AcrR family transcriptional regulator [Candidatus Auribacterota bacterium]